jgi:ubiquitin-activating enzyme E1
LEKKGLELGMVSYGKSMIFNPFMPSHKDRMKKDIKRLLEEVSKQPLPTHKKYADLVATVEDADGNDVEIPMISIPIR